MAVRKLTKKPQPAKVAKVAKVEAVEVPVTPAPAPGVGTRRLGGKLVG